jgi:drug/metabolite transporter (DMT)-like permease
MRDLPSSIRGGLWMMASALSFTIMTALIREVAKDIHPFEIGVFRVVTNLLLMLPFAFRTGRSIWVTDHHKIYAFRGLIGTTFLLLYFSGAALIPVSDTQALIFTTPLFASLMAVVFLRERLRGRRTAALVVGFLGALIIIRPGFATINLGSVLVLLSAIAYAASFVTVRHTTRTDHPDMAVFYLMLYMTPLVAIPALFFWTTPTLAQVGLMIAIGFFATLNQRFFSRAFAVAETTAVMPFDFSRLPFAALIGWLVFAEVPDMWVWIGGIIIFSASLYIAHREVVANREETE